MPSISCQRPRYSCIYVHAEKGFSLRLQLRVIAKSAICLQLYFGPAQTISVIQSPARLPATPRPAQHHNKACAAADQAMQVLGAANPPHNSTAHLRLQSCTECLVQP
eukprot:GHRR01027462.1.p1 GENE.GHRR01027462.1~~GHRR01027462.1.p1  ORF type:complete len:107 (-),score=10.23 GHRR01027462.1:725-1045(-)